MILCLLLSLSGCGKIEEAEVAIKDVKALKEKAKKVEMEMQIAKEQTNEKLRILEAEQRLQREKVAIATKQAEDTAVVAKQRIEELEKRNNATSDGIKWIVVLLGIGGVLSVLYKPSRNLLLRGLFKNFSYKPRKFDKDNK